MDEKFCLSTNPTLLAHTKTDPFQTIFYPSTSPPIYKLIMMLKTIFHLILC
ncbi:hypothetical protein Hanom_Chr09g00853991 [Helianthus anomalus]